MLRISHTSRRVSVADRFHYAFFRWSTVSTHAHPSARRNHGSRSLSHESISCSPLRHAALRTTLKPHRDQRRHLQGQPYDESARRLRALMRRMPYPVAIVTACAPLKGQPPGPSPAPLLVQDKGTDGSDGIDGALLRTTQDELETGESAEEAKKASRETQLLQEEVDETTKPPPGVKHVHRSPPIKGANRTYEDPLARSFWFNHYRGITVSSFNTVTMDPTPAVSFNIKRPSRTLDAILETGILRIHPLTNASSSADIAKIFASNKPQSVAWDALLDLSKRQELQKANLTNSFAILEPKKGPLLLPQAPELTGYPILASLYCQVLMDKCVDVGDHMIVVAKPQDIELVPWLHSLAMTNGQPVPTGRKTTDENSSSYHGMYYVNGQFNCAGDELTVAMKRVLEASRRDLKKALASLGDDRTMKFRVPRWLGVADSSSKQEGDRKNGNPPMDQGEGEETTTKPEPEIPPTKPIQPRKFVHDYSSRPHKENHGFRVRKFDSAPGPVYRTYFVVPPLNVARRVNSTPPVDEEIEDLFGGDSKGYGRNMKMLLDPNVARHEAPTWGQADGRKEEEKKEVKEDWIMERKVRKMEEHQVRTNEENDLGLPDWDWGFSEMDFARLEERIEGKISKAPESWKAEWQRNADEASKFFEDGRTQRSVKRDGKEKKRGR